MITFKCQSCSVDIEANDDEGGQIFDCPSCGQPIEVPYKKVTALDRALALSKIIVTTTNSIEGHQITQYLGVVSAEVIYGANFLRDIMANLHDSLGGRVTEYESVIKDARQEAMHSLKEKAAKIEANALLGLRVDSEVLGAQNGMLMITAMATAVKLQRTSPERGKNEC
jgi:uncharacterized protein YbjQ (UPF0145 family)